MGFATSQQKRIAVIAVAMVAWIAFAEEAPRRATGSSRRGEAIVFSGSASDAGSTNLTLNNPKAGLKSLEDDIKKPFDFFDRDSQPSLRPLPVVRQPQMIERTKRSQELMQSKEDAFFNVGKDDETDKADDPYSLDPEKQKLKSPLERYYERVDRERAGVTNQFKSRELFGDIKPKDEEKDLLSTYFGNNRSGDDPQVAARTGRRMSNNPAGGGLFSTESAKPRTLDDLLRGGAMPVVREQDKPGESRLDIFKKLIGAESFAPQKSQIGSSFLPTSTLAPAPGASPPARPSPSSTISAPLSYFPSATTPSTPAPGLSGNLTKPYGSWQGVQAYGNTPSLMPVPIQQPKPKPPSSSFSLPQRKF